MSDVLVMNGLGTTPLTPVYAALEARNVAGSYVWQNPIARLGFEACATDALAGCFAENAPLSPAPRHPYLGGIVTGAAEAGGVLGPLYGSLMLDAFGWRSVFWVNVPLSAVLLVLVGVTLRVLPTGAGRVDYLGALLAGSALLALTLALSGGAVGIERVGRALLFAAAAVTAALFVVRQARAPFPLVSPALFRRAPFASASAANLFVGAALVVALVEVPLFATVILGMDATEGGLTLLRLTAFIPVGAVAGGWLAGRLPYALVSAGGMLVSAAGFVRLSLWDDGIAEPALTIDLAVTGLGFGLVLAPFAGSALGAARGGAEAVAAALLTVARTVGMTVALAALSTWGLAEFDRRVGGYRLPLQRPGESDAAYERRLDRYEERIADAALYVFGRLFLVAATLCVAAAVLGAWLRAPDERPGRRLSA